MHKKYVTLVASGLLVLSLAGCGTNAGQNKTTASGNTVGEYAALESGVVTTEGIDGMEEASPMPSTTPMVLGDLTTEQIGIFETISKVLVSEVKSGSKTLSDLDLQQSELLTIHIEEGRLPSNAVALYGEWKDSIHYYQQFEGISTTTNTTTTATNTTTNTGSGKTGTNSSSAGAGSGKTGTNSSSAGAGTTGTNSGLSSTSTQQQTKPIEQTKPVESKPVEQTKPVEQSKPVEQTKPAEQPKPVESKPVEQASSEQTASIYTDNDVVDVKVDQNTGITTYTFSNGSSLEEFPDHEWLMENAEEYQDLPDWFFEN